MSDDSARVSPTFLPAFSAVSGATVATNGVTTPEGTHGIADPNWGGANVWLSTDNSHYSLAGQTLIPARQGVLTATLGSPPGNPDTTNTWPSLEMVDTFDKLWKEQEGV